MKEFLIAPSVPGSTSLITMSAGIRAGHIFRVSLRPEPEEDARDDDEHHDPGAGDGRGAARDEERDAEPPAALAVPSRQVEPERGQHDEGGAERDRMLRGAEDAQLRGAELQERLGLARARPAAGSGSRGRGG